MFFMTELCAVAVGVMWGCKGGLYVGFAWDLCGSVGCMLDVCLFPLCLFMDVQWMCVWFDVGFVRDC